MKQIALRTLLVLFGLFGAACGTAAVSPQPAATEAATQPAFTETAAQPAPTAASTPQATATAGGTTQVEVTLADNTITSSLTSFKVGVPYAFVIKNIGRREHSFSINQPVAVTGSLDASLAGALLDVGQKDLPVGGGATVEYSFPDNAVGMPLEFSCLIKRHYDDNMRLAITVTK